MKSPRADWRKYFKPKNSTKALDATIRVPMMALVKRSGAMAIGKPTTVMVSAIAIQLMVSKITGPSRRLLVQHGHDDSGRAVGEEEHEHPRRSDAEDLSQTARQPGNVESEHMSGHLQTEGYRQGESKARHREKTAFAQRRFEAGIVQGQVRADHET